MLPSPPQSLSWSDQPPPYYPNPVPTRLANVIFRDSHLVYLHPILESALLNEHRKPLPADVNNHLGEPATKPGLGFITIILLPIGRHVPVQPSAIGRGTVTLGDVLQVLRNLSAALLGEQNVARAGREAAYRAHAVAPEIQRNTRQGVRKGLWTWVVDDRSVAGYLTIDVEDVVWPRR
jgi:hypothetical protein